jgi:hypothetical protein
MSELTDWITESSLCRTAISLLDRKIVIRKYGDQWFILVNGFSEPIRTLSFEIARWTAAWMVDMGEALNISFSDIGMIT